MALEVLSGIERSCGLISMEGPEESEHSLGRREGVESHLREVSFRYFQVYTRNQPHSQVSQALDM